MACAAAVVCGKPLAAVSNDTSRSVVALCRTPQVLAQFYGKLIEQFQASMADAGQA
jgi:hypothetical protein